MEARGQTVPGGVTHASKIEEVVVTRPVRIELMEKLLDVEEDYLASLMAEIEDRCGSVDAYLDAAGLNAARRERLRARFLTG